MDSPQPGGAPVAAEMRALARPLTDSADLDELLDRPSAS